MATKKTGAKPTPKKKVQEEAVQVKVVKPLEEATPEEKIAEISSEIIKVEADAKLIVIESAEDYEKASAFLTGVVQPRLKRVEAIQKFFTDPYVEQRRVALVKKNEIEALISKQIFPLTSVESAVKRLMSNFQLEQDRKARAEEEKLRVEREKKEAAAAKKGKELPPAPIQTVERQAASVKTISGQSSAIKVWKFEVLNEVDVPRQYCEVKESLIRAAVNSGVRQIAGVRIYEDFDIRGKTNG